MSELDKLYAGKSLYKISREQMQEYNLMLEPVELSFPFENGGKVTIFQRRNDKKLFIFPEEFDKIPEAIRDKLNFKNWGNPKHNEKNKFSSTHPIGKALLARRKLWVISEENLDQLFWDNKIKVMDIDFDDGTDQVIVFFYQSVANKNIYILPDDLSRIPNKIREQLNIRYSPPTAHLPKTVSTKTNQDEKHPRGIVLNSGRIVINDDSIIPRCKSVSMRIGDKRFQIIGYLSGATGSLLVPASVFIKNIPMDLWHNLNLSDPRRLLPPQGLQGSSYGIGNGDLQDCSILFKYGYSVRKSVPYDIRRKALNAALADHTVTKEQAIRHINHLIALNQSRYPDACARWRDDIEYLNQLPDSDS